uniref:Uncharacterized protein n=1 Tax=Gasterosteus aculeatus aculeatus TaxID=481459 RepID=A0AAQ4S1U8_GASAC
PVSCLPVSFSHSVMCAVSLRRRAELLQQRTEGSGEQLHRRRQAEECEAARRRNGALLQVNERRMLQSSVWVCDFYVVSLLQTRYWASVEESLPAWEDFFLGKGPHPAPGTVPPPRRARLPPRQRPRTARLER